MSLSATIRLVKSLSGSEKRFFKVHTRLQKGNNDYLFLFEIIDKSASLEHSIILKKLRQKNPNASMENTTRYLMKVLTDCLVQSKTEKDPLFELLQGIMRVRVLQERSLNGESYRQLKKIRQQAHQSQQYLIEYFTYRYELNHLADSNFPHLSDQALVEIQMKAKDILKSVNNIQDHHSLFEQLKYRLVHSGKVASDEDKKRLNDLMLSEMILVAGKSKNNFAAQKLHLLFQSFFFTDIGDYKSALKTFYELNSLFEQNVHLLDHPPLDYLSSLNGILDSLVMLRNYDELGFYINMLKQLDQAAYPEYFRYMVRKTIVAYSLAIYIGKGMFQEAVEYIQSLETNLLKQYSMVNEEKQWELYFYCSLAYFGNRDFKKAHLYIREIIQDGKLHPQLLICKAVRLLNIIIHFERGDIDYLEYEIRSYKRFFEQQNKLLESEKIILKTIQFWSAHKRNTLIKSPHNKMLQKLTLLKDNKYEKQLLKYFDFTDWIIKK